MSVLQSDLTGPIDAMTQILVALGLPGLIIFALAWLYWDERSDRKDAVNKVIQIGAESIKAQEASTAAINALKDMLTTRGKSE